MPTNDGGGFNLSVLENAAKFNESLDFNPNIESIEELGNMDSSTNKTVDTTESKTQNKEKGKETKNQTGDDDTFSEYQEQEIDSIEDLDKIDSENKKTVKEVEEDKDNAKSTTKTDNKEIKADKDSAKESSTPKTLNALKVFGENLAESGVIDFSSEEFEKSSDKDEYFTTKVAERIAKGAEELFNERIGELPAEIEELVKLHKEGVPLHSILEADKRIDAYEKISSETLKEDEILQKQLVQDLLEAQGIPKEKIPAKLKRFEDLGILEDEANDALETLKTYEKESKEEMIRQEKTKAKQQKDAFEARIKSIEDTINSKSEILGIQLNKDTKKKLIDGILKPVGKTADGKAYNAIQKARMDDPEYDLKVAAFTILLGTNLDKIEKKAETKAVRKLSSVIDEEPKISKSGYSTRGEVDDENRVDVNTIKGALDFLKRKNSIYK